MLPPVDPVILTANPRFGALYQDLCNNKLNPDGTSKADAKAQRDRDGLSEVRGISSFRRMPFFKDSIDAVVTLTVILDNKQGVSSPFVRSLAYV